MHRHVPVALVLSLFPVMESLAQAPPTITLGSPCPAVVTYAWDLSEFTDGLRVRWELKRGSDFTVPDGDDPGAVAQGTVEGLVGSVALDLRDHGPVLDKTPYFFRVVARRAGADRSPRSPSAVFTEIHEPAGMTSFALTRSDATDAILSWSLTGPIAGCADRVFVEVRKGSSFPSLAPGPSPILVGEALQTTGFRLVDLGPFGEGEYVARLRARYGEGLEEAAVGTVGAPLRVTVARPRLAELPTLPPRGGGINPIGRDPNAPPPDNPTPILNRSVVVPAAEASLFAQSRGYTTSAVRESGSGTCRLVVEGEPGERFYAFQGFPTGVLTCRLDLFEGRDLAPGWRLVDFAARLDDDIEAPTTRGGKRGPTFACEDNGGSMDIAVSPSDTGNPHFTVWMTGFASELNCLAPANFVRLFVDSITLEGPSDNWRLAFSN